MDKVSVVRIIVFLLLWVNVPLSKYGYDISWIEEETISITVAAIWSTWSAWKNNYLSKKGKQQKEVLVSHKLD